MRPTDLPRIAHDPAVFEAFYREHIGVIQAFVARRVADPHLAADLTADVFVAAIDAAPSFQPRRGDPRAWLFGVARNVVKSEHRRADRMRRAQHRIQGRRLLEPDDIARAEERIDAAASSREIYAALGDLPEGERAAFELHALDGFSPSEVAAVLGIRPITARVRLHRARAALRGRVFDSNSTQPMEART